MIPVLLALALLGMLVPEIGLALPSPDFVGPLLTWVVAMLGFFAAGLGVLVGWVKQMTRPFERIRDRQWVWVGFLILVAGCLGLLGTFTYLRYSSFLRLPPRYSLQDMPFLVATSSTGLLSERVATSTILIPTSILKDVVQQPDWDKKIVLLDVREAEERGVGMIDASTTWMRLGDLVNGAYRSLPMDRDILVICWNSMRGEETVRWLRARGFERSFGILGGLQGAVNEDRHGWIPDGLPWIGLREANDIVRAFEDGRVLTVEEAKNWEKEGAQVVDMRDEAAFANGHIVGARNLHLQTSTSEDVEAVIRGLEKTRRVLIYSDDSHSDFYAEVLELRLRGMGYEQVGMVRDEGHVWGY